MSDVIVSTTASTTNVTTTNNVTTVAVTDTSIQVSASTVGLQGPPGSNTDPTYVYVRNATGVTLSKGSIVYTSGGNGTHTQVSLAIATSDETSARVLGWLAEDIANNASGLCMIEGYLDGINTQGVTEGSQLYLSGTVAGAYQTTKPQAPVHLVYVGVCVKASAGNGRVFVKVQNGYEIDELHNVQIISVANKDLLQYDSVSRLWKNVASTSITPGTATYSVTSGTATYATTSGTSVYATSSSSATVAGSALAFSGSITKDRISDLSAATVTSASTAQQAGTAIYASTSASAVNSNYAVTAGTSVYATSALTASTASALAGSITKSQVSDFTSGTVVAISGTVLPGQVQWTSITNWLPLTAYNYGDLVNYQGVAYRRVISGTSGSAFVSTNWLQITPATTAISAVINITKSQVSDFTSGTVASASTAQQAGTAVYATTSGTASYATTSGTAVYATTSGTAATISGSITRSQVTDYASGTVANISGTAANANSALNSLYAVNAGTAVFANTSASAIVSGTAVYATTSGTSVTISGSILASQVSDFASGTVANISGTVTQAQVSGLSSTLSGYAALGSANTFTLGQTVNTGGTANKGLVVKAVASQSANLQEWQVYDGTTITSVNFAGLLSTTRNITIAETNAGENAFIVRSAANHTGYLTMWQNSSSTTLSGVSPVGQLFTGSTAPLQTGVGGATTAASGTGSTATITLTSAPNVAVGDRITVAGITPTGYNGTFIVTAVSNTSPFSVSYANATTGAQTVAGTVSLDAQVSITTRSAATIGLAMRGVASQAGDYIQIRNSANNIVARTDASGNIYGTLVSSLTGKAYINEAGLGGVLNLSKTTTAVTNLSADQARIYLVTGTTGGTLKLVIRGGASGAETTILDNIPQ